MIGIFNFSLQHLSIPCLLLGVLILVMVWICCATCGHCRRFSKSHKAQTGSLVQVAQQLQNPPTMRMAPMAMSTAPIVTLQKGTSFRAPSGILLLSSNENNPGSLILQVPEYSLSV